MRKATFALWSAHALAAGLLLSSIQTLTFFISSFFEKCTAYQLLCGHKPIKNYAVLMVKIKLNKIIMDLVKNKFQPLLLLLRFAEQQVLHMSRNGSMFSELSHTSLISLVLLMFRNDSICLFRMSSLYHQQTIFLDRGWSFVFSFSKLLYVFIVHQDLFLKSKPDFPFVLWCDPFNFNTLQADYAVSKLNSSLSFIEWSLFLSLCL